MSCKQPGDILDQPECFFNEMIQEEPSVPRKFIVERNGRVDSTIVIGDRAFVEDGGLVILQDCSAVAAFPPGEWAGMTSILIPPVVVGGRGCCNGGSARECPEDYCEE
jgi:hypothetical protein